MNQNAARWVVALFLAASLAPPAAAAPPSGRRGQHSGQQRWWCDGEPLDLAAAIGRVAWTHACGLPYPAGEPAKVYEDYGYPVFQVPAPTHPGAPCGLPELDGEPLLLKARCWAVAD